MRNSKFTIMKDKEFAVIGALCGMDHFFGCVDLVCSNLSKQEIQEILYRLYKKEFLKYEHEKMVIAENIEMLFSDLKKAKRLMSIVNPITSENHSFYYLPHRSFCINVQKGWEDSESIKLRRVNKSDVISICDEAGLFPKQILNETLMQGISIDEGGRVTKESLEISVYDLANEHKKASINVRMEGLNDVLIYARKEVKSREIYRLDHLKNLIETLLQEEA